MRMFPAVFAAFLAAAWATTAAAADLSLVLLHTNDMHSRFDETDVYCNECREDDAALGKCYGGFARIAETVRQEKQNATDRGLPSLFMVAGDTFQGTAYFSFFKWKPCVDFIRELKPDIMTLGNHEFDDGVTNLVSYLKGINTTIIPTVVSNLNMTAEPELNELVSTSHVFTINNTKVGVVGYLTTDTPTISNTGAVEFYDEIECLKKETKKLRDAGVNIIIGLGHSGIEKDKIIAKEVEEIDLIVGGHSHTFLYSGKQPSIEKPYGPYPFYVTNVKNKPIPILQAYANTKYFGKVELRFDSNGVLVNINGEPMIMDHNVKEDPSMLKVLDQWKPSVTKITNVTVGRTVVELLNICHQKECNIGNLITDSFVYYNILTKVNYSEQFWTDAPISLIQSGGIRTSISEVDHDGYITLGQLLNVIPFMNKLVKVTVSGQTLLEAFEHSVFDYMHGRGSGKFLQVSGVKVDYDLTQSPGNRILSMWIRCGNCAIPKYEPLALTANYTIIMNDYLAGGGDDYKSFQNIVKKTQILGIEDYNATATYMTAISPIMTGVDGRINFKIKDNVTPSSASTANYSQFLLTVFTILLLSFNF
ncbi:Calcineurin-like phosphoesterase domain, ApaH type,Metallo-dependent phosphatase-like,5'- [Cinara cedri]|uniref:5'-nucleotidase n=1 Tax=Cinara cedri TaxID=506608 RepID=A0A5E4MD69_9HEMI|nr:Calcineurin-like phosphoesterase domain, ApaH type,Metallo-dependent phosphatase-like,5'- [Cinara cedri]